MISSKDFRECIHLKVKFPFSFAEVAHYQIREIYYSTVSIVNALLLLRRMALIWRTLLLNAHVTRVLVSVLSG